MIISRNGPTLSHLFYVDDIVLFTKATRSQVVMVEGILTNFENMLGLKVNISNSRDFFLPATTIRSRIELMFATIGIWQTSSL